MSGAMNIVRGEVERVQLDNYLARREAEAPSEELMMQIGRCSDDDLLRRARGEVLLDIDKGAIDRGEQMDEHEVAVQRAIQNNLLSRISLAVTQPEIDTHLENTLRGYQSTKPDTTKDFAKRVLDELWDAPESSQPHAAHYFGVLSRQYDNKTDPIITDKKGVRHISELKAELIARKLDAKKPDIDKAEEYAARLTADEADYHWKVLHPSLISRRVRMQRYSAVAATAAVLGTGVAMPNAQAETVSASTSTDPVIVATGNVDSMPVSVVGDSPQLSSEIVVTPVVEQAPTPKVTIIKSTMSSEQPITPVSIDMSSISVAPSLEQPASPPNTTINSESQVSTTPDIITAQDSQNVSTPENANDNSLSLPAAQLQSTVQPDAMPSASQSSAEQTPNPADTQTMPSGEQTTAPEQPTSATPTSGIVTQTPESSPSTVVAPEQADGLTTQEQLAAQLVPIVQAGVSAKSIAVLQGGEAKPNDPKDKMDEGLVHLNSLVIGWIQDTLKGDTNAIQQGGDAWDAWRQEMLNDPTSYTQEERNTVQLIESQATAYELAGLNDQAAELRALASYNTTLQQVITNPDLYRAFSLDPIQQKPTPEAQTPTINNANNPYAHYQLSSDQLALVDQIAERRNWQDWQKQMFVDVLERAVQIAYVYHINPAILVSQAVLESGNFKSGLARHYYNLFGIKGSGNDGSVLMPTSEWRNGKYVHIHDKFAAYKTPGDGEIDYASHLLQLSHFKDARWFFRSDKLYVAGLENKLDENGKELIHRQLAYATSPDYEQKMDDMERSLGLRQLIPKDFFLSPGAAVKLHAAAKAPEKTDFSYKAFHDNKNVSIPGSQAIVDRAVALTKIDVKSSEYKQICPGNYKHGKYIGCTDLCDHVVAYVWGNDHSYHDDAYKHWKSVQHEPNALVGTDRNPPIGAFMFWGSGQGHVAVYLGNNKILTTDLYNKREGKTGGVYIANANDVERMWGLQYHGWAVDPALMHTTAQVN